ncbi:MAG: hypothetical protein ACM3YF_00440, partial [Candidatus Zixiibacteriota bacterium]
MFLIGRLRYFEKPPELLRDRSKAKNSIDNPLLCFILQAGHNKEVIMNRLLILAAILTGLWND